MLGETPQNPGTVLSPDGKPIAQVAPETTGVDGKPTATPEQPSPTTHSIVDTEYYALNPNKPTEFTLGKHVKENQQLAAQFNAAQSKIHVAENKATALQADNDKLQAQMKKMTDGQFVTDKLKELGIGVTETPASGMPVAPTPGPTVTPGVAPATLDAYGNPMQTDAWGNPIASPVSPAPIPVPASPVTITPENINLLVAALKEAYQPDFADALGQLKTEALQQDQERSLKDQTSRYFSDVYDAKIEGLVNNGIERIEASRIASIEREARETERKAEELYKVVGPQRAQAIETANALMGESDKLRNDASVARSQAITQANEEKIKQDARNLLETDVYVGVDQSKLLSGDPNEVREYTEAGIEAAKKNNLETAIKITEERQRVSKSAGIM